MEESSILLQLKNVAWQAGETQVLNNISFDLPETILRKSINELSGGEKQRVSLIRNLQFLPKVLLLDEITSALDEANKRNVNELIHHYVRDKNIAVLWVTHDKDEITHADNVITLQPHAGEMQEARNERA